MNWEFAIGCGLGSLIGSAITMWIKNKEIQMIRKFTQSTNQESNHSPSQQSSVDKREIVHTKKISDVGENPILDTKFANSGKVEVKK